MAWLNVHASLRSWVANLARDLIDGVEGWFDGLSTIDFVLTVLVVWAGYWIWSTLRAITRLGPIEVKLLDHDGGDNDAPDVNALTALMRERLAKSGLLPPPEVPAGSPQANLIAAVESSGQPQAAWIAKALQLLPHPPRSPEFKLSGTILNSGDADGNGSCGLRYWLQPKYEGGPQLDTIKGEASNEAAVSRAAADIFLGISGEAAHVFPQWAQWTERSALVAYVRGIDERFNHDEDAARASFETAATAQEANLLPQLQLANLLEKTAGMSDTGAGPVAGAVGAPAVAGAGAPAGQQPDPAFELAKGRAEVLRKYLDIGVARSDLVAARYRAGIVAGMLASACSPLNEEQRSQIRDCVGFSEEEVTADTLADALHDLAADEGKAAYQLVGRFHIILDKHRMRHRYEPTGVARRRLRRTIAISRHTLRIRRLANDDSPEATRELRKRRARVRWLHLGLFRASAGWTAHYNAGCFYSLLYARELELLLEPEAPDPPDPVAPPEGAPPDA